MKQTGIWIDKRVAKIVTLDNAMEKLQTIESNIEEFNPNGGSGTRKKGGPQDVVQDSKYLERGKHQFRDFFNDVAEHIKESDALVIFGPAQTGEKLCKELSKSYPQVFAKIIEQKPADSMTDNQIRALVRNYFTE